MLGSCLSCIEQGFLAEWVVQQGYPPRRERLRSRFFITMSRDEDDRDARAGGQLALQLQATYPRHSHIQDQAFRLRQMIRMQKLLRGGEDLSFEPNRFEQTLNR